MDISKLVKRFAGWVWPAPPEVDGRLLDGWIHDALIDDALASPPSGTWEKLCMAIRDRRPVKSYGMWILDEPFRDPPETLPTVLSHSELQRVLRIQSGLHSNRQFHTLREAMWSTLPATFIAIVNW